VAATRDGGAASSTRPGVAMNPVLSPGLSFARGGAGLAIGLVLLGVSTAGVIGGVSECAAPADHATAAHPDVL